VRCPPHPLLIATQLSVNKPAELRSSSPPDLPRHGRHQLHSNRATRLHSQRLLWSYLPSLAASKLTTHQQLLPLPSTLAHHLVIPSILATRQQLHPPDLPGPVSSLCTPPMEPTREQGTTCQSPHASGDHNFATRVRTATHAAVQLSGYNLPVASASTQSAGGACPPWHAIATINWGREGVFLPFDRSPSNPRSSLLHSSSFRVCW
jgi:hypothetical protein